MSSGTFDNVLIEPERYELFAEPAYRFDFDRRDFLKTVGGGIVVCLLLNNAPAQEPAQRGRGRGFGGGLPQELGAWLHIDEQGAVTVYTGKVEVGQNIRTSLTQVVAEELRLPVESIRLVMADTDLVPFDMGTFGSNSTPGMAPQLQRVAAAEFRPSIACFRRTDRDHRFFNRFGCLFFLLGVLSGRRKTIAPRSISTNTCGPIAG